MKISLKLFLLIVLTFECLHTAKGQPTMYDSINLQLEDKLEVRMILYNRKKANEKVENDLKNLQVLLKDNKNIPTEGSWAINYKPNQSLSIKEAGKTERIIWGRGIQAHYEFNNQCNILASDYFLNILFNDVKDLESPDMIAKIKEVLDSTNKFRDRIKLTHNYNYQHGKLTYNQGKVNGDMDALQLKANIGAGLIKNQLVTDFTAEVGLVFSGGGLLRHQYYTSYNLLYFVEDGKTRLNPMFNIGYRYNTSRIKGKYNWLGVEFGFLKSRNGTLFDKNTLKLSFNWELGKYTTVSPQIFFTSDFSKAYPGIRIGFGL